MLVNEGAADDQDGGVLGPAEAVMERPMQLIRGMRPLAAVLRERRDSGSCVVCAPTDTGAACGFCGTGGAWAA